MGMARSPLRFVVAVFLLLPGCGAPPRTETPPSSPPQPSSTAQPSSSALPVVAAPGGAPVPAPVTGSSTVTRSALRDLLAQGAPVLLAKVEVQAAFDRGAFKGFRITRLKGTANDWRVVDLQPGDVVLRIQGKSVERPEAFNALLRELGDANVIEMECERAGQPHRLTWKVIDGPRP
jgi:S1-C subfamily serine protease